MPNFVVKSRKKGPVETTTVDAATRNEAIAKTIETAAEGEEIEIFNVEEAAEEAESA